MSSEIGSVHRRHSSSDSDSWNNFLATINMSPSPSSEAQKLVLLERAVRAFAKTERSGTVDVPVAVCHMPCCDVVRSERTCEQEGTVWRMIKRDGEIIHLECGKRILEL